MSKLTHGIRSVKIENFRCIDKLELDFTDPHGHPSDIIVIGGPNGSGKTAVLEACLLAVGGESLLKGSKGQAAIRQGTSETRIEVSLNTRDGSEPATHTIEYIANPSDHYWSHDGIQSPSPQWIPHIYFPSCRTPKLVGALPISSGKHERTDSILADPLPFIKQRLINDKAFALMGGNGTANDNREMDLFEQVWKRFYPWTKPRFTIGPAGSTSEAGFDVFLHTDESKLSVDELGSGQLELFTLFGTLVCTHSESSIVFIDEPELHLDPQWHAMLLHDLRKFLPDAQFIVSTHSPRVAESVRTYERFFILPENHPRMKTIGMKEKQKELVNV